MKWFPVTRSDDFALAADRSPVLRAATAARHRHVQKPTAALIETC